MWIYNFPPILLGKLVYRTLADTWAQLLLSLQQMSAHSSYCQPVCLHHCARSPQSPAFLMGQILCKIIYLYNATLSCDIVYSIF